MTDTRSATSDVISRGELKEAAFKSLRWVTLARVAAEGLSLASGILLAHLVPPEEFGRVALTVVLSELALALANQGAGSVLVQRRVVDRAHVEATAMLTLLIGAALTLATFFLLPFLTTRLFGEQTTELFRLLSPVFTIAGIGIVPLAMLERQLDFRRISMIEITTVLVGALSSIGLAVAGFEAEAYVLGFLSGMVVWAVLVVVVGPGAFPRWRPHQMREIAGFGLPAGLASMTMVAYGNVDYLILGARLSAAQVGFYYRAYTLGVHYETKISNIVARVAFPLYSRTESVDHMRQIRSRVVRINATVIYPMLALFVVLAPELVPWVFGERWQPAVVPAQILAIAGMARMVNNGTPALVLAAGRPRALLAFNLYRFLTLGAAVLVAVQFGLIAVCITVSCFQVVTLIGSYALMLPRLVGVTLRQLALDLGPAIASSAIMLGAAAPLAQALTPSSLPALVVSGIVCTLGAPIYLLSLRLISPSSWSDVVLLARKILPGRRTRKPSSAAVESSAAASG